MFWESIFAGPWAGITGTTFLLFGAAILYGIIKAAFDKD